MSWCTNPCQRSARWTTSLRAGLSPLCGTFLFLSNFFPVGPNSVTSAAHTQLDSLCLIQTQSLHGVGFRTTSQISILIAEDQLTRTFLVVCVASAAFYILPPFPFFMGLGISQPAVVPSPTLFPLAHTLRFREALPTAGSHTAPPRRELFFSPLLLSHHPPYRQVNTPKLSPSPSVSLCLCWMPPQDQLFLSVYPGSLMLEDLPYERFKRGWKLFFCLALCFISHCFTDHLSLLTTPTSPKGTPGVAEWLPLCRASSQISLPSHSQSGEHSTAQHSTQAGRQAGKCFTCCFIQNIHKELRAGTQLGKATPPLLLIGWRLVWRQAGRHSNRLSDLLFIYCLARICGNVSDDVETFSEAGNWWLHAKKKKMTLWNGKWLNGYQWGETSTLLKGQLLNTLKHFITFNIFSISLSHTHLPIQNSDWIEAT